MRIKLLAKILMLLCLPVCVSAQPETDSISGKILPLNMQYNIPCPKKGNCNGAFDQCVAECRSVAFLLDNESEKFVPITKTDFVEQCQDACLQGLFSCEYVEEDKCFAFSQACDRFCPSLVRFSDTGKLLTRTEAKFKCADACIAGAAPCEKCS